MPDLVRGDNLNDELSDIGDLFDLLRRGSPAWHKDAACKEAPPEVSWFPAHGQRGLAAKRVCQRCLCLYECRAWALGQGAELAGIWGGLDERERRAVRAGRRAA